MSISQSAGRGNQQQPESASQVGANSSVSSMLYSTITKKVNNPALTRSTINTSTMDIFKKMLASQFNSNKGIDLTKSINIEAEEQRQTNVVDLAKSATTLKFQKKSRKMGNYLYREVKLEGSDLLHFSQTKGRKRYPVPYKFLPQTKAEYDGEKRGIIWPADKADYKNCQYRILCKRKPPVEKAPAEEGVSPNIQSASSPTKTSAVKDEFDSAFYFDRKEDFIRVRNYFHCFKILDREDKIANGQEIPPVLQTLGVSIRRQIITKVRKMLRSRAEQIQKQSKMSKQQIINDSRLLKGMDNYMRTTLIEEMRKKAEVIHRRNLDLVRVKEARESRLKALNGASILHFYDKSLITRLLTSWQQLAEQRKQPDRESVTIAFRSIEIPADIVKPTFKITVLVERKNGSDANYLSPLNINDESTYTDSKEFQLATIIKKKINSNTLLWKLAESAPNLDDFVHSNKDDIIGEGSYTLRFNSLSREYINCLRLKFTLHDENDQLRALSYAKFEHLYRPSKRGHDICLSLGTSPAPENLQHLLHVRVHSHNSDNPRHHEQVQNKLFKADYIQDTFFDYAFSLPRITPRHHKFLSLLPESWKVLDETLKNTHRSGDLGKWVQRVKYRLARHYHRSSARHLAKLEQTHLLWASLQDELARYSANKSTGSDDIYIDEDYLRKIIEMYQPRHFNNNSPAHGLSPRKEKVSYDGEEYDSNGESNMMINNAENQPDAAEPKVVSYLFKRDRWESVEEWRPYYLKLREICHRGIPPQLRKFLWSELGRVCYFIELSETFLAQAELQRKYEEFDPGYKGEGYDGKDGGKSRKVYEKLKSQAMREFYYLYQELEEDIDTLREKQGKEKLDYETNLRNICKTFIYWSHLFANIQIEEAKYYVSYSRALLTICQSLVIGLSCSYLQGEVAIEEDTVFWLLISITTYILASYYETNEEGVSVEVLAADPEQQKVRKNNKITTSALRCPDMKGIKGDLLLLKLLVKELEPQIYNKFEELGLPVEEFFADHMLTLFSTMFSPALTYRLWDLIFLEGSASNQVRSHRTIAMTIFTVLRNCKRLILSAKTYKEVSFILEIYSKFEVEFDSFLEEIQDNISEYLEQALPASGTFLEKISFIKFAFFSKDFNKFDNKIREIETSIQSYTSVIFEQNKTLFGLVNTRYRHLSDVENESLTYATLAEMISKFISTYSTLNNASSISPGAEKNSQFKRVVQPKTRLFADVHIDQRGIQKPRFTRVQVIIHRLTIYWPDLESLNLRVSYDKDTFVKKDITSLNVNYPVDIVAASQDQLQRKLYIEIYNVKEAANSKKVKWLAVDLKTIEPDTLTKMVLKFNEEGQDVNNDNFTTSEVEFSILLIGLSKEGDIQNIPRESKVFNIPELQGSSHSAFSNLKFDAILQRVAGEQGDLLPAETVRSEVFTRSKNTWKKHFAMSFEEYLEVMKKIAPFWVGIVDFAKVYNVILRTSSDQTFYFNDFITLLVLFGKFSFRQKMSLLFEIHAAFNDVFKNRKTDEVTVTTVKGLAAYLYETFMVYIPNNEVENMIDNVVSNSSSIVLRAVINPDLDRKVILPASSLNRLANYMHHQFFTKDIYVGDVEILNYLRNVYLAEVKKVADPSSIALLERNRLEINYINNGMRHKFKLEFDNQWNPLLEASDLALNSLKSSLRSLYYHKTVVPMNYYNDILDEHNFIKVFEFLPMIDYLCGFENIKVPQQINEKTEINFMVTIAEEECYMIRSVSTLSQEDHREDALNRSQLSMAGGKQEKVIKEWISLVSDPALMQEAGAYGAVNQTAGNKSQSSFRNQNGAQPQGNSRNSNRYEEDYNSYNAKHEPIKLSKIQDKVSIYFPLHKLISQIKRYIIKDLYKKLSTRTSVSKNPNPKLFNPNLYDLDFEVAVSVGVHTASGVKRLKSVVVKNFDLSVFECLYQIEGAFDKGNIAHIDTRINLKQSMPNRVEPKINYDQLALYRYADASTEWLPCIINFKFVSESQRFDKGSEQINFNDIEGFGVIFEGSPNEVVLKRKNEVALVHDVDILEIDTKRIREETYKQIRQPNVDDQSRMYTDDDALSRKFPSNFLSPMKVDVLMHVDEAEEEEHRRFTALDRKGEN